jgi:cation transport ATPase
MTRQAKPINKTGQGLLNRSIFLVGWLLSPFSFWNDAFVNIPLSYLSANIIIKFVRIDFLMAVLISYWISNILGIAIMFFSGRMIIKGWKDLVREALIFMGTVVVYSVIVVVLHRAGVLKPL